MMTSPNLRLAEHSGFHRCSCSLSAKPIHCNLPYQRPSVEGTSASSHRCRGLQTATEWGRPVNKSHTTALRLGEASLTVQSDYQSRVGAGSNCTGTKYHVAIGYKKHKAKLNLRDTKVNNLFYSDLQFDFKRYTLQLKINLFLLV